jgi:hypothetical protein
MRLLAPVGVVAHELDGTALGVGLQGIGSGADRKRAVVELADRRPRRSARDGHNAS